MENEEIKHHTLTKEKLIKTLLLSILFATIILITIVLPQAYGIDMIGTGKLLGVSGQPTTERVEEKKPTTSKESSSEGGENNEETITILIPANHELEYKFRMEKDQTLISSWETSEVLYFDFHGEPEGDTTGYYKTYEEGRKKQADNEQVMPFTGSHGWYWKNDTDNDVTISLKLSGEYTNGGEKFKSPIK